MARARYPVRIRRQGVAYWALLLGIIGLVVAAIALAGPVRTWYDLGRCRRGYRDARTAGDSLRVDSLRVHAFPAKGGDMRPPVTCSQWRRANPAPVRR